MEIAIEHLKDGAKNARGVAVIIDVFRAFSVEACLFNQGAKRIFTLGDYERAYDFKKENHSAILIGERNGVKLKGFDFGNSPSEIGGFDFKNRTVYHTTSAGTQGIANAKNAERILVCSLLTAKATAKYILKSGFEKVTLVAMGLNGDKQSEEDELCAEYIKSVLEGKEKDIKQEIKQLKYTSGAKFFDKAQQKVFPQADFDICTNLNRFNFVMVADVDPVTGLTYTEKRNV